MEKLYEQIYKYVRNCFIGIAIFVILIITIMGYELNKISKENKQLKSKPPETIVVERNVSPIPYDYLGEFILTHYCDCPICTGTAKGSRTASGTKPKEGRTIACDGKMLKMGDIVYIETIGLRICEDRGGAIKGNKIDVFVADHNQAVNMGVKKAKVYKLLWL